MKAFYSISFWKKSVLAIYLGAVAHVSASSQCQHPYQYIKYDTVMTGTGNGMHTLTIPQFDPSVGTLIAAEIHSYVSLNYGFTLKNVETVHRDFIVSVVRNDHIQSAALQIPYDNSIDTTIGSYSLNPGGSISKSPYTILYRYENADSIFQNTGNFLGHGSVQFKYKPLTYTNLTGSDNYYYSASANDTIRFSVTYYYCPNINIAAPASLTEFSARKREESLVVLDWATENEQRGRIYEIQKSLNGTDFIAVAGLPSKDQEQTAHYAFGYPVKKSEFGKLYFRLGITDQSGNHDFSDIKMVDMGGNGNSLYLYPNPSEQFVHIVSKDIGGKNRRVDIFSSNGILLETHLFANTSQADIQFRKKLLAGVYFARVTDIDAQQSQVLPFVVR